jgi:hypothetical protein
MDIGSEMLTTSGVCNASKARGEGVVRKDRA